MLHNCLSYAFLISSSRVLLSATAYRYVSMRTTSRRLYSHFNHNEDIFYGKRTVKEVYDQAVALFQDRNIPDAQSSARYLLCLAADIQPSYSQFNSRQNQILCDTQVSMMKTYCNRRCMREPVQYIVGDWDFFGKSFKCRAPVLIPRPETENLIEHIMEQALSNCISPSILDIGCGTGVIGITLLDQLLLRHSKTTVMPGNSNLHVPNNLPKCTALDINPIAIALSMENADHILSSHHRLLYKAILSSFKDFTYRIEEHGKYDIIVSNPPYIPSDEIATLEEEVSKYEDRGALDGGNDGFSMINKILKHSAKLLSPTGTREIWLEVHHTHADIVRSRYSASESQCTYNGCELVDTLKDAFGVNRFLRFKCR
jgi:release factor glutamine methyltransferase